MLLLQITLPVPQKAQLDDEQTLLQQYPPAHSTPELQKLPSLLLPSWLAPQPAARVASTTTVRPALAIQKRFIGKNPSSLFVSSSISGTSTALSIGKEIS
ncbi:MAG: hypothetical protein WCG85_26795 [Polyangia bacterium]